MSKTVKAEDTGVSLATLLDEVERGGEIIITRAGAPVARLTTTKTETRPTEEERRQALERSLQRGWNIGAGPLNRDELHER
ncbi:MAG TPA: type II toxin-antitoxin system prevent-host-death family antitoxin [Acetobacteraceae bacterium]|nr:type II toxin-antitoxin system prevent-host-death family antitoxin [Acetobacteraceae bacterium]